VIGQLQLDTYQGVVTQDELELSTFECRSHPVIADIVAIW
jgi:hypothetical protein